MQRPSEMRPCPGGIFWLQFARMRSPSVRKLAADSEGPVCLYSTLHELIVQHMIADTLHGA